MYWEEGVLYVIPFLLPDQSVKFYNTLRNVHKTGASIDAPKINISNAQVASLERYFCDITGLPLPPKKTRAQKKFASVRWWTPLRYYLTLAHGDMRKAMSMVQGAVSHMREAGLTISAPASIESVLLDRYARDKKSKLGVVMR